MKIHTDPWFTCPVCRPYLLRALTILLGGALACLAAISPKPIRSIPGWQLQVFAYAVLHGRTVS